MRVAQAYRFELDPNDVTADAMASHVGADRFAFNWGLALVKARLGRRARVLEQALIEGLSAREAEALADTVVVPWTLASLRREWNQAKADVVRLPRLGVIRTKEPTTKLLGRLDAGTARTRRATVSTRAGRWYVSFGVEADRADPVPADPASVIGVDVGVTHLAVLSTGEMVPNPKPLSRYARRLARLSAQAARQHKGSRRRAATKARIARCHAKVADLRIGGLHKLTTRLATTYGTIVVEDLNVAGMTRRPKPIPDPDRPGAFLANRAAAKAGLNRAILDAAPAELRRQLTYKCTWYGARLVTAGRFYPSSKTCSACGTVKAKLSLAEREYGCNTCGLVIDRDLNAALNLAALAARTPPPSPGVARRPKTHAPGHSHRVKPAPGNRTRPAPPP